MCDTDQTLASLIKCKCCDGAMVQLSSKGSGYYGCRNAKRKSCNNKLQISRERVEVIILNDLKKKFLTVQNYGKFSPSAMNAMFNHFNSTIRAWAMRKYKKLNRRRRVATCVIENIAKKQPGLFIHWEQGILGMTT